MRLSFDLAKFWDCQRPGNVGHRIVKVEISDYDDVSVDQLPKTITDLNIETDSFTEFDQLPKLCHLAWYSANPIQLRSLVATKLVSLSIDHTVENTTGWVECLPTTLTRLKLSYLYHLASDLLNEIATRLPDLKDLGLRFADISMRQLLKFRALETLTFEFVTIRDPEKLAQVRVKHLIIYDCDFALKHLPVMPLLSRLTIRRKCRFNRKSLKVKYPNAIIHYIK